MTTTSAVTDDFIAEIHLPADPDTVMEWFTAAAGVSRWWGPTEGDGGVGGSLTTSFGEHGTNSVRVLEAGASRVVWESIVREESNPTGHAQEWLGTRMEFDLVATDVETDLRFRHAGLTPRLQCWQDCFDGWTYFMASIETLASTGVGTPFAG